jgi:outer membrane usher protein
VQLFRCRFGVSVFVAAVLISALETFSGLDRSHAAQEEQSLQLEVFINGAPANMISSFVRLGDGKFGATKSELEQLGLRIESRRSSTEIIPLDEIPTLQYRYDEPSQKIFITVEDASRVPHVFDLHGNPAARAPPAQAGWGVYANCDLLSATGNFQQTRPFLSGGTSLTVDARAFSPYGTLNQSALVLSGPNLSTTAERLNTSYRYSDQDRLISYGVGDEITGGLAWTRPIRIGGAQAQSNFALRPDLVTMPLPTLGGTAAVPSTVDVYVNNIKTFSQNVGAGPFSVSNVPLVTGAGNAQLVITDSAGQQTKTSLPFYASSSLLAPGLNSWSIEGGLPRLAYGSTSDAYVDTPVASATLRRGIFDWLTIEGHAEGGGGLANGGVGAAIRTGTFGVADVAVAGSKLPGNSGLQTYLSYETRLFGLYIHASLQRTFANYNDLASATTRLQKLTTLPTSYLDGFVTFMPYLPINAQIAPIYNQVLPPREIDQFSIGASLPFDKKAGWNLSYLRQLDAVGNLSNILSASYSRSLPYNASLFATVFSDFGTNRNTGVVVGLSIPLGQTGSVTSSVSAGQGGTTATVDAVRSLGPATGDYGWEVRDSEGASSYRATSFSYRTGYLTAKVGVSEYQGSSNGALELRGSIASMGGDVFFSDWIDDGFAVVNVGAPGVEVSYENRPIGKTDSLGMILLPSLRSYQKNLITVDPTNLPADAEIQSTRDVTAPADRAGVLVQFKVQTDSTAALVVLLRTDGRAVPAGSAGRLDGGEDFVVGYDGQAFIKGLQAANSVTVQIDDASCHASFSFAAKPGEQVRIGPVTCQ